MMNVADADAEPIAAVLEAARRTWITRWEDAGLNHFIVPALVQEPEVGDQMLDMWKETLIDSLMAIRTYYFSLWTADGTVLGFDRVMQRRAISFLVDPPDRQTNKRLKRRLVDKIRASGSPLAVFFEDEMTVDEEAKIDPEFDFRAAPIIGVMTGTTRRDHSAFVIDPGAPNVVPLELADNSALGEFAKWGAQVRCAASGAHMEHRAFVYSADVQVVRNYEVTGARREPDPSIFKPGGPAALGPGTEPVRRSRRADRMYKEWAGPHAKIFSSDIKTLPLFITEAPDVFNDILAARVFDMSDELAMGNHFFRNAKRCTEFMNEPAISSARDSTFSSFDPRTGIAMNSLMVQFPSSWKSFNAQGFDKFIDGLARRVDTGQSGEFRAPSTAPTSLDFSVRYGDDADTEDAEFPFNPKYANIPVMTRRNAPRNDTTNAMMDYNKTVSKTRRTIVDHAIRAALRLFNVVTRMFSMGGIDLLRGAEADDDPGYTFMQFIDNLGTPGATNTFGLNVVGTYEHISTFSNAGAINALIVPQVGLERFNSALFLRNRMAPVRFPDENRTASSIEDDVTEMIRTDLWITTSDLTESDLKQLESIRDVLRGVDSVSKAAHFAYMVAAPDYAVGSPITRSPAFKSTRVDLEKSANAIGAVSRFLGDTKSHVVIKRFIAYTESIIHGRVLLTSVRTTLVEEFERTAKTYRRYHDAVDDEQMFHMPWFRTAGVMGEVNNELWARLYDATPEYETTILAETYAIDNTMEFGFYIRAPLDRILFNRVFWYEPDGQAGSYLFNIERPNVHITDGGQMRSFPVKAKIQFGEDNNRFATGPIADVYLTRILVWWLCATTFYDIDELSDPGGAYAELDECGGGANVSIDKFSYDYENRSIAYAGEYSDCGQVALRILLIRELEAMGALDPPTVDLSDLDDGRMQLLLAVHGMPRWTDKLLPDFHHLMQITNGVPAVEGYRPIEREAEIDVKGLFDSFVDRVTYLILPRYQFTVGAEQFGRPFRFAPDILVSESTDDVVKFLTWLDNGVGDSEFYDIGSMQALAAVANDVAMSHATDAAPTGMTTLLDMLEEFKEFGPIGELLTTGVLELNRLGYLMENRSIRTEFTPEDDLVQLMAPNTHSNTLRRDVTLALLGYAAFRVRTMTKNAYKWITDVVQIKRFADDEWDRDWDDATNRIIGAEFYD